MRLTPHPGPFRTSLGERGEMAACGFLKEYGYEILEKNANPATIPATTPSRGALMINRSRATALGIILTPEMGAEAYFD